MSAEIIPFRPRAGRPSPAAGAAGRLPSAGRQQPEQPETLYPDLEWLDELVRRAERGGGGPDAA